MIPIHFKRTDAGEPPKNTHYIVARNGLFVRKKMWWVDAVVPVQELKVLNPEHSRAKLLLPALPAEVSAKALKLSKAVYDLSKSEVCLLLHYGMAEGYQLTVPEQVVCPGGIEYDASERLADALFVGTIHSHGQFEACHSGVDHHDEEFTDGVHITFGDIQRYPKFSLSAEIAVNGKRFPVDREWFEGLIPQGNLYHMDDSLLALLEIPPAWLQVVEHLDLRKEKRR